MSDRVNHVYTSVYLSAPLTCGGCKGVSGSGTPPHLFLLQQHLVDVHGGELAFNLRLLQKRLLVVAFVLQFRLELLTRHGFGDLNATHVELVQIAVKRRLFVPPLLHGDAKPLLHRHAALKVLVEGDEDGFVFHRILGPRLNDCSVRAGEVLVVGAFVEYRIGVKQGLYTDTVRAVIVASHHQTLADVAGARFVIAVFFR